MVRRFAWVVILLVIFAQPALARRGAGSGYYLGIHFLPTNAQETVKGGSSGLDDDESSVNSLTLEGLLGFNFGRIYVGGIYHSQTMALTPGNDPKLTAVGASLGAFFGGFVVMVHSFMQGSVSTGDDVGTSWGSASGLGADLIFMGQVSGNMVVGAGLAHRALKFKIYNDGTTEFTDAERSMTTLSPRLTFGFIF